MKLISFGLGSTRLIATFPFAYSILNNLHSVDLVRLKDVLKYSECSDKGGYLHPALNAFIPTEEKNRTFAFITVAIFFVFSLCIFL